jgi:hypothetical protein
MGQRTTNNVVLDFDMSTAAHRIGEDTARLNDLLADELQRYNNFLSEIVNFPNYSKPHFVGVIFIYLNS